MAAAIKQVTGGARLRTGKVTLDVPPIVENGNTVPLSVSVESPMTADEYVKAIHVFNEKNPQPHVFSAWLSPGNGKAVVGTRIKLADTQKIVAIAETSKGAFWTASAEVIVTSRPASRTSHGPGPHQCAQDRQEGRGRRDQGADPASRWRPASGRAATAESFRATSSSDFTATWNGNEILRMDLSPAIAANPFVSFFAVATESGTITFRWTGDEGFVVEESVAITLPDLSAPCGWPCVLARGLRRVLCPGPVGADRAGADKRRSGYQDMGAALQKMQDDDTANPGMLFVQLGQQLWSKPAGAASKACADCHSIADMKGVAARYPAMPTDVDKPIDLEGRIRLCRTANQQAEPFAPESRDLLPLLALSSPTSRAGCR